ncbi:MAG: DUF4838 domain-containing protein [Planctomycetota bacterium]|nr:MAG: DUF4838 domain-containing protein [Planctomycetota bacterium]
MEASAAALAWMMVAVVSFDAQEAAAPPDVVDHGRSDYVLVVAEEAGPATRYAAGELQRWLKEMTGAELPIVADTEPPRPHEILVGPSKRLYDYGIALRLGPLGQEGYVLRTVGERLLVAGGEPRGTLYAVYGLLGDHLGCRWFTPEVSRIPRTERLPLPQLDESRIPALEYRDVFIHECHDGDWAARNRLNSSHARLEARHGGRVEYAGFVHTFNDLVPVEKYFETHPEYFSEIDGKREREQTQLCCTNEEVVRIVTEEVRRRMREHPEAMVFSVSQNDWFRYCQCGPCAALAAAEGSQMAPVLQLVNRVAEAVEEEFPDKAVDTLAYQWTRRPPKTLRPRRNVIVRLCSIECCFAHPLASCDSPQNQAFVADLEGWALICDRLWVWDYVTDFAHYLRPFPNLRVLDANIRLLAENHVTGIFEEGNYSSPQGEFQALRGYVLARCLWDPACNALEARDEFLAAVYGPAAGPIRRYLELLHFGAASQHLGIYDGVDAPYLGQDWQDAADKLFDAAETAAAGAPELLARVRAARLPVDYVAVERARAGGAAADAALAQRVRRFFAGARECGLTAVAEWNGALEAYEQRVRAIPGLARDR